MAETEVDEDEWEKNLEEGKLDDAIEQLKELQVTPSKKAATEEPQKTVKGRGSRRFGNEETAIEDSKEESKNSSAFPTFVNTPAVSSSNITPTKSSTPDDDEDAHVLEIYNFDPHTSTEELHEFLEKYKTFGYQLKWVDDTHAIVIFKSRVFANDALKNCSHPEIKLRPIHQGTRQSKLTYEGHKQKVPDYMLETPEDVPKAPRPQTSTTVARRLIGNALQIKMPKQQDPSAQRRKKQPTKDYWNEG